MAVLPIRVVPDLVLRQRARRVSKIDRAIDTLLADMVETMRDALGIGLAANQVGVLLRVIVIELPEEEEDTGTQLYRLINPQIVKRVGSREVEEGCLSIPDYRGLLMRSVRVTAKGLDPQGREVRLKATDLLAQALEHEIDHLNGILYLDHLESHERLWKLEPAASASGAV